MMIDAGTPVASAEQADGILDFWVDGVEVGPWKNRWWRTDPSLQVDIIYPALFFDGDRGDAGHYFDNLVVSTQRVGCP